MTWNRVILSDGAVPASATSVIYNAVQGAFYAFIRRHGLYSSIDGQHFTRLPAQPTAGLASANCPAGSNSSTCLIYRGEFAVVPGRNEMYVWVVDEQPDQNGDPAAADEGIWQIIERRNGPAARVGHRFRITASRIAATTRSAETAAAGSSRVGTTWSSPRSPMERQRDVYAGAINLYKCTLSRGHHLHPGRLDQSHPRLRMRPAGGAGACASRSAWNRFMVAGEHIARLFCARWRNQPNAGRLRQTEHRKLHRDESVRQLEPASESWAR